MPEAQQNSLEIEKWLKLAHADNVGPKTFERILETFGSVDNAMGASVKQLMKIEGVGLKKAQGIAASRDSYDAEREVKLAEKVGVWIINLADARYPPVLKNIYDPPPVIYVQGTLKRADNLGIAIVGSRRCSSYGREHAGRFGHLLAASGFTVYSGLAAGIDSAAHQGALAGGARTIAVQGCGLGSVYPPENKQLAERIVGSGARISELPLGAGPRAENFPPRNRIIAGLSLATIVIEANIRSGALITAEFALENNREVMAIPGRIDSPLSMGCHKLIKDGARLVDSMDDVMDALEQLGHRFHEHTSAAVAEATDKIDTPLFDVRELNLSESEREIYDCLGREPLHVDDIIEEADLAPGVINSGLISLRLKGLIKQFPGAMFSKK